jgi:hypothetical protein
MSGIGEGVYTYYLVQQPNKQSTPIVTMTPTPVIYTAQDVYKAFVKNQVPINSHYDDKLITVTWREVGFPAQSTSGMLLNDTSIGFSDSWPLGIYVFSQESNVQQDVAAIIDANTPGPHMRGPYYYYAHHWCLLIGDQRMSLNTIAPYEKVMMNACL